MAVTPLRHVLRGSESDHPRHSRHAGTLPSPFAYINELRMATAQFWPEPPCRQTGRDDPDAGFPGGPGTPLSGHLNQPGLEEASSFTLWTAIVFL
jgi:hypothetical protein